VLSPVELSPKLSPWVENLLSDPDLIRRLVGRSGSPIHLINPGKLKDNAREFQRVLDSHGLDHLLLFARKANSYSPFIKSAKEAGIGVDTASYNELVECLELGMEPGRLVVTAAMKPREIIRLAVEHQVTLILDNEDECLLLEEVAGDLKTRPAVGIRIGGFHFEGGRSLTRFGFPPESLAQLCGTYCHPRNGKFDYRGLHFHLNGYSISERKQALGQTIDIVDELEERCGLKTGFIDIGGGILCNYLQNSEGVKEFERQLGYALAGERPPLTYDNDGLGLRYQDCQVQGRLKVYPYSNESSRAAYLEAILTGEYRTGIALSKALLERNIQLRLEPGRSLLDQSGITLARVSFRKSDSLGRQLVGLEMNGSQMRSASAEFLVDPFILYADSQKAELSNLEGRVPVYFVGGYCLESDLILKREIALRKLPEVGDVVIFVNTAGYRMNFYQTRSHLYDEASVVVLEQAAR
jgi:diaminopimelate decarboxylase